MMEPAESSDNKIPLLRLSGTPRERGFAHGEAARRAIEDNVAVYSSWFKEYAGISWEQAREHAPAYREAIKATRPSFDEEMLGIADGAHQDVLDIIVLNARTEIAYGASGLMNTAFCECTALGVEPSASRDNSLLVGENWDWLPDVLPNTLLCHMDVAEDLEVLTITEAGMLAKFGVNSAGIAICNNLLASNRNRVGHTFHTLARAVLETRTLTEAARAVTSAERAGSGNYLLCSAKSDEIVDLEWAPGDFNVLQNSNGVLAHANNFIVEPPGIRDRTKILPSASPGTYLRTTRAQRYLEERVGSLDVLSLKSLLRDHRESPEAICRHTTGADHEDVFGQSNLSVIFDMTRQEMHWTYGPPCQTEYRRMPFPWSQPRAAK